MIFVCRDSFSYFFGRDVSSGICGLMFVFKVLL